jgi:uncharacterized protein with NAD-binding domain and iron-sulfur cluster
MASNGKTKVAILGGGPAGLVTAFDLCEAAPDDFEITVYQMGWRLGGKGTSGYRSWTPPGSTQPIWNRIEEHGLHILFGFYETFFSVMRTCYRDLDRAPDHPLSTFEKAFAPRDFGTAMFRFRSRWEAKHVWFHRNRARPGAGEAADPRDTAKALSGAFANLVRVSLLSDEDPNRSLPPTALVRRFLDLVGSISWAVFEAMRQPIAARPARALQLLRFWQRVARRGFLPFARLRSDFYLLWLAVDFFAGLAVGVLEADLLDGAAYETLDHLDYRDWLVASGIHRETAASPLVSMIYHAAFSYERGDPQRARIAAGSALRLIIHAMTAYRGSAYYQMRGGMGEVVFVPLMRALEKRGVRFELFHKVDALRLDSTRSHVESIELTRQARLAPGRRQYDPLIRVKGVEAFPSEPLFDQLEGDEKTLRGVRFESYYQAAFPTGEARTLMRGQDFDVVVLATPVATLPYVAAELLQDSARWRDMVQHVKSVQTLSLQVWFGATHAELGWVHPDANDPHTLLSMYWTPMSTWVPMDQTLAREQWPRGMEPHAVSYFTGAQHGPELAPDPTESPHFPAEQQTIAIAQAADFVCNFLAEDLLPNLEDDFSPPLPRFDKLHDPDGREGSARLQAQFARSNCEPSERVTLALPGATRYRMQAGDTDYENLVIAGDWIDNGIQLACMEGAFTGGRLASDAVLARSEARRRGAG